MKTIMSVVNVSTHMITSISTCHIRLCDTSDNVCLDLQNSRHSIIHTLCQSVVLLTP